MDPLFQALADVLDGPGIEAAGRAALLSAQPGPLAPSDIKLPPALIDVLHAPDALNVCALIAGMPFDWVPPQTSTDPAYVAHSHAKVHVELIGPTGLCPSDTIRLGLYGILPNAEYGIRTHPAEEVFVMLAGEADWKRGEAPYAPAGPGDRSLHPSMLPHATRTRGKAFMSIYIWNGDISTANYVYQGLPAR